MKHFLITAALALGAALNGFSQPQTYEFTLSPGTSLIGSHFLPTDVLDYPDWPAQDGDTVRLWNPGWQNFQAPYYYMPFFFGGWIDLDFFDFVTPPFPAGSGALYFNASSSPRTVSREFDPVNFPPVTPVALIPNRYHLLANQQPAPAEYHDLLGAPAGTLPDPSRRTFVWRWDADDRTYSPVCRYADGTWAPSAPSIPVGEAAFVGAFDPGDPAPSLVNAEMVCEGTGVRVRLTFDRPVDPVAAAAPASYLLSGGPGSINSVRLETPDFAPRVLSVLLDLTVAQPLNTYSLEAPGVSSLGGTPANSGAVSVQGNLSLIAEPPASQTAGMCETVSFRVAANGAAGLTYRWFHDATLIAGANAAVITLTNVQPADAGDYRVEVSDCAGTVVAGPATLTVIGPRPPIITAQPQSQTVLSGGFARFIVAASFNGPLSYQWNFAGQPITSATNAVFWINSVQPAQVGAYSVTVASCGGAVESAPATLTVTAAATISGQVFYDFNSNGARDSAAEYGLTAWVVRLDAVSPAGSPRWVTTDVNGQFRFDQLTPGTYSLVQEGLANLHPSPWLQTFPLAAGAHAVTVATGQDVTDRNFGVRLPAYVPSIEWQRSLGGSDLDWIGRVLPTADGGYLIGVSSASHRGALSHNPNYGSYDYWLVRLDAYGQQLWERDFGGSNYDILSGLRQTRDGGFIVSGASLSGASGNKTAAGHGSDDYWVLRLNADGGEIWQRSLGAGSGSSQGTDVAETSDGGFLVCGFSDAGADGDKTDPGYGGNDGWVVRLDSNGNKLWDKCYGGTGTDTLLFIAPTAGGRFLLAGQTYSGATGNKTSPAYGDEDYWVLCINEDGSIVWDRTFGGVTRDRLSCLTATSDGGALLGGYSFSPIGGNRTSPHLAHQDAWCVRIDADGNKVWERGYAGAGNQIASGVAQTPDGGFVIGCWSNAGPGYDKLTPLYTGGGNIIDMWILRTDANGVPLWDQTYGGTEAESYITLALTPDGGVILGCNSTSSINGNKTTPEMGNTDTWLVKLAPLTCPAAGPVLVAAEADCQRGQVTVRFNTPLDPATALLPANYTFSGGTLIAQHAAFGPNTLTVVLDTPGLASGITYTLAVHGVAGECLNPIAAGAQIPVACPGEIRGRVFNDANNNCTADAREFGLYQWPVKLQPGPRYTLTDLHGNYSFAVPAGNYTISAPANPAGPWNLTCPAGAGVQQVSVANGQITSGASFGATSRSATDCADLWVDVTGYYPGPKQVHRTGANTPCCNANFFYHLNFGNYGANPSTLPAYITFYLPYQCTFVSANPPSSSGLWTVIPPANSGDPVTVWFTQAVPSSPYQDSVDIEVHLDCDATVSCDDPAQELQADAAFIPVWPGDGECNNPWTSDNNYAYHSVVPCCSFDPNDCTVEPKGCGPEGYVNREQPLTYLIQFQNIGGGRAHQVIVRNEVDEDLDLATLEILGSSHPNLLERNGRELKWIFPDIELASAGVDEPASHGYVKYRIRPRPDAPAGTVLNNSAEIFFDDNEPITTIVTTNTLTDNPMPVAAFRLAPQRGSAGLTNDFFYTGGTLGAQLQWYFGPDAIPQTSTEMNPPGVIFTRPGRHVVSLRVSVGDCMVKSPAKVITAGQPRLNITKAGSDMALTWQGEGFIVQEAESLTAPIQWRTIEVQPIGVAGWNFLAVSSSAGVRFYRLAEAP